MESLSEPPSENRVGKRLHMYVMLGIDVGLASWIAIDVYVKTNAPGPREAWAVFAWLLVFVALWLTYKHRLAAAAPRDDGEQIIDAGGAKRSVAHAPSAGLLAANMPPELLRDVRAAGVSNLWTQHYIPNWRIFLPIVILGAGMALAYWGTMPPVYICFSLGMSALLSNGYNPMPSRMAEAYLRHGHCPSCTYALVAVPVQADGHTICPECGAAWIVASPPPRPARTAHPSGGSG